MGIESIQHFFFIFSWQVEHGRLNRAFVGMSKDMEKLINAKGRPLHMRWTFWPPFRSSDGLIPPMGDLKHCPNHDFLKVFAFFLFFFMIIFKIMRCWLVYLDVTGMEMLYTN